MRRDRPAVFIRAHMNPQRIPPPCLNERRQVYGLRGERGDFLMDFLQGIFTFPDIVGRDMIDSPKLQKNALIRQNARNTYFGLIYGGFAVKPLLQPTSARYRDIRLPGVIGSKIPPAG